MTAPAFQALATLQDHDAAIARLRHRRAHLEQRVALAALRAEMADRAKRVADVNGRWNDAVSAQSALESELAATEARVVEIDKRMYSGSVTASRDLQAMSEEVAHLKQRASGFEEQVLEAMEAIEPIDAELQAVEAEQAAAAAEAERLEAAAVEAEADIMADLASEEAARVDAAAAVPAALLEEYEQLRTALDGIGAARLVGNQCTGCHLALPATEIARIRREPEDVTVYCDNCGRILVR